MQNIPTEEQLRKEIREMLKANPKFKQCINCMHFNHVTQDCAKVGRKVLPYVPACTYYDTNEEKLLRETIRELHAQARECEKIEFLLAMALTSANMTTLFIEDFERRVRAAYRREKAKKDTRREAALLKKDLDLAEQMDGAFDRITAFLEKLKDGYHDTIKGYVGGIGEDLEKIDAQYRHYIQSHVDKIFKKTGEYNVDASDNFQSDAGEFATLLLEFARIAHHNKENADKVYKVMADMTNEKSDGLPNTFCLDNKDIAHYRMKD